jgi:hypothetical protein
MAILSRDQILAVDDLPRETVEVKEWGGELIVRTMTGAERDAFELSLLKQGKGKKQEVNRENFRARLVAATAVDESGDPIFQAADVTELGKKSSLALQRVFNVSARLNGFTDADIEELAKNSEAAPGESSPSD